jgi:hypothetical protein
MTEVLDLEISDALRLIEDLGERREAEAKAIKDANKGEGSET